MHMIIMPLQVEKEVDKMNVSYLLIEAVCLAESDELGCCKCNTKGIISVDCLVNNLTELSLCRYLGFKKARTAIALTDKTGNVIAGNEYFDDFTSKTEVEYDLNETNWIKKCTDFIQSV